jgi:hypothetical protein
MSDLGEMLMPAVPEEPTVPVPSPEEKEYSELLERALKGAEYLERTDLTPEQRRKGERLYDAICEKVLKLRAKMGA